MHRRLWSCSVRFPWIPRWRMDVSWNEMPEVIWSDVISLSFSPALFWQSPKRPPNPIVFDINDPLWVKILPCPQYLWCNPFTLYSHTSFVVSFARLYAAVCGVTYSQQVLLACYYILYSTTVTLPLCHIHVTFFVSFQDLSPDAVSSVVMATRVPPFKPSSKVDTKI